MFEELVKFYKEEDGMGTVELVIIVAVLVGVALIFRKELFKYVENAVASIFSDTDVKNAASPHN